ncbi:MAG: ClpXP protease specificity-enhancing factor SspB [Hyphomonadaceae bacterium]|nr:ClpXP protease specificity-enhancing factor SspB [Hyphomonadaceae bacterium]
MDRSPGSAKDHIGFQALTQAALKSVVRSALQTAAALEHLPGEHHFYVTFRTRTQGVQMADYLKDRFPDEMTIVIQHQYWDFEVFDDRFEIILKFSGVPQHLRIPFAAVTRFFDPSVNFGLQFDRDEAVAFSEARGEAALPPGEPPATSPETADGTVISLDAFRRK